MSLKIDYLVNISIKESDLIKLVIQEIEFQQNDHVHNSEEYEKMGSIVKLLEESPHLSLERLDEDNFGIAVDGVAFSDEIKVE